MKFKEIAIKSEAEARKLVSELRQEAQDLKVKMRMGQEKQTHKLKLLKKDIARLMTHLHQFFK